MYALIHLGYSFPMLSAKNDCKGVPLCILTFSSSRIPPRFAGIYFRPRTTAKTRELFLHQVCIVIPKPPENIFIGITKSSGKHNQQLHDFTHTTATAGNLLLETCLFIHRFVRTSATPDTISITITSRLAARSLTWPALFMPANRPSAITGSSSAARLRISGVKTPVRA